MTLKHGIVVANGVGTIDSDYRGEIKVILHNCSQTDYNLQPGEKIAQMIIAPYLYADFEETDTLDETLRGSGGFGHSGK
jgi:dUTP pyrophosphatase